MLEGAASACRQHIVSQFSCLLLYRLVSKERASRWQCVTTHYSAMAVHSLAKLLANGQLVGFQATGA